MGRKKPRPKEPMIRSRYTRDKLKKAIARIKAGEKLRKVSRMAKIPRRTLRYYISGSRGLTWSIGGRPTILLPAEEQSICQHIALLGDYGYAFDIYELRLFVKSFLDKAERSIDQFVDNMPGKSGPNYLLNVIKT